MAQLPLYVAESNLSSKLRTHLKRTHQGKVRDTYKVNGNFLLVVATDRISIFDFVLNTLVKDKGKILTAMTIFYLTKVLEGIKHHLIACGAEIDNYLPRSLQNFPELQERAVVVRSCEMTPVEAIVRRYLTGSGLTSYQKKRQVCGIALPEELHDGSRLDPPIFTPTTKATEGNDQPLSRDEVVKQYPWMEDLVLDISEQIATDAETKGIIFADSKFELAGDGTLCDEVATPDSSRFWDAAEWKEAQTHNPPTSPISYDKQFVREWGKKMGIDKRKPTKIEGEREVTNWEDVNWVHGLPVPETVTRQTTKLYHTIFERLTGASLTNFQQNVMQIGA